MNQAIETRLAGCLLAGTFLTAPSQVHAQPAPIPVVSAQAVTLDQLAV